MCYRNLLVGLAVLITIAALGYKQSKSPAEAVMVGQKKIFPTGEKMTYAVKMGPIKMGISTLTYLGQATLGKRKVVKIIFETTGFNFLDREVIYADEKDFYPLRVERTLNLWGKKMEIIEDYDTVDNSWRLTKKRGGKITQEVFKSDSRVQNIISLVYFYRQMQDLEIGKSLAFDLSNAKVTMRITGKVDLSIGGKVYKAYLLQSTPRKYRVWLDAGEKRLPLRIDGSLFGFSNMSMIMREHN